MNSAACAGLRFASRGRHACPQASATSTNDGSTGADTTTSAGRPSGASVSVARRQEAGSVLGGLCRPVRADSAERLGEGPDRIPQLADAALLHRPLRRRHRLGRERHVQHVVVDARIAESVVRGRQQQRNVAAAERRPLVHRTEDPTHRPRGRRVLAPRQQLVQGCNGARALDQNDHDRAQLVRGRSLQGLDLGQRRKVHVHPAARCDRRVDRRTRAQRVLLEAVVRELPLDRHGQPPRSGVSLMNPTSRSVPSTISRSSSVSCLPLTITKNPLRRKLSMAMSACRSHSMRRGSGIA